MMLLPILLSFMTTPTISRPVGDNVNIVPAFNMTVIHINDIHAHFEETNVALHRCRAGEDCYGGMARVVAKVKDLRRDDPEAVFLNAGDFYQGTIWYTKFKYKPFLDVVDLMNYTAMGLGNHDFDDKIGGLVPFAKNVKFPMLAANIDEKSPLFGDLQPYFNKSTVVLVHGRKVGIIGYVTRSTSYNFPKAGLKFLDEIETVGAEAKRLKESGVDIIIAAGHSGYDIDQQLAAEVEDLDLVVGGHSHTFLYTGPTPPSTETPQGPYPTYVTNKHNNKVIPVVQAFCFTKYLGHLKLSFDSSGDLMKPVDGGGVSFAEPVLLDSTVEKDAETEAALVPWRERLVEFTTKVGSAEVDLVKDWNPAGASKEFNIGDVIADSMAEEFKDTSIAMINNGGIRGNIGKGEITGEDIFAVLPFNNTVDRVVFSGEGFKEMMEEFVKEMDPAKPNQLPGLGMQMSGVRMEVTITPDNAGHRITKLQVLNIDGVWSDISPSSTYTVAMTSFLASGASDHWKVIGQLQLEHKPSNRTESQVLRSFIKRHSPLKQEVEGRWRILYPGNSSLSNSTNAFLLLMSSLYNYIM